MCRFFATSGAIAVYVLIFCECSGPYEPKEKQLNEFDQLLLAADSVWSLASFYKMTRVTTDLEYPQEPQRDTTLVTKSYDTIYYTDNSLLLSFPDSLLYMYRYYGSCSLRVENKNIHPVDDYDRWELVRTLSTTCYWENRKYTVSGDSLFIAYSINYSNNYPMHDTLSVLKSTHIEEKYVYLPEFLTSSASLNTDCTQPGHSRY